MGGTNPWVIGVAGAAVPEPSGVVLMSLGMTGCSSPARGADLAGSKKEIETAASDSPSHGVSEGIGGEFHRSTRSLKTIDSRGTNENVRTRHDGNRASARGFPHHRGRSVTPAAVS
jgi:hypothetical protein